ncbi:MAG: hypothetical protein H6737_01135 [Alphaproteobacteria bacterium]|nr:hypothetical protein [Alphaproteobacteria bacterium]
MWLISLIVGCGGGPAECGPSECADICAKSEAPAPTPMPAATPSPAPSGGLGSLTSYEGQLLGPLLEDVRAGVRPWGPEGIGICKAQGRECAEYLGTSASSPLGEGEYMLRAELAVPKTGEKGTWKVKFDLDCTLKKKTDNGESTTTSTQSKEYDVIYAGEDRGYRLQPLWTIKSPNKYGEQDCKYKITGPHPDGDKVYEGSWLVPAEE